MYIQLLTFYGVLEVGDDPEFVDEVFSNAEMYGISFEGHPGLRHIYLPAGFEGNPLRKDYPLLARRLKPWRLWTST